MNNQIEAFILAGGRSSRMGSEKGLVNFRGEAMIRHVIRAVELCGLPLSLITADERYRQFGYPLHADMISGAGPLGGLYTALSKTQSAYVVLLSCDLPLLRDVHLQRLMAFAVNEEVAVAVDARGRHPLCAVYPSRIFEEVERRINQQHLRMLDLLQAMPVREVYITPVMGISPLANINTPADLLKFEPMDTGNVKVLLFGWVREAVGAEELLLPFSGDTAQLMAALHQRYPALTGRPFRVAVNKVLCDNPCIIKQGDEVALLPPFSGG